MGTKARQVPGRHVTDLVFTNSVRAENLISLSPSNVVISTSFARRTSVCTPPPAHNRPGNAKQQAKHPGSDTKFSQPRAPHSAPNHCRLREAFRGSESMDGLRMKVQQRTTRDCIEREPLREHVHLCLHLQLASIYPTHRRSPREA